MSLSPEVVAGLSKNEIKLLQKAIKRVSPNGEPFASKNKLREALKCDRRSIAGIIAAARKAGVELVNENAARFAVEAGSAAPKPPAIDASLVETDDIAGDKRTITKPRTSIRTLEDLVKECNIDLTVWHVDRFIANKWEMGAKDNNGDIIVTPLYQVKAFLSKLYAQDITGFIKENSTLRARIEKMSKEVSAEKRYSKHLALNHLGADEFLGKIHDFMATLGDLSLPYQQLQVQPHLIAPVVKPGHNEDAVFLLSDTHFGDRIKREDTCGFPEFDLTISGNRFGYVIRKAKQCLTLHRSAYPLKNLKLWFGGDIGNGILHDSPNSNELFTPAQVHFSYHMLKFGIEDLLTLTVPDEKGNVVIEHIDLLFTVGNHMRMDEKMPHKYQAQRTLDWLIYQFVIERFKNNPKISIKAEMSPYIFENIRGHRHLFAHGMQVGYRNSPDAQCKSMGQFIDRVRSLFDSPEWRRSNNLMGATFDRVCIGDIHVPVSFPRLISNGSLNGQNELGVNWVLEPIPAGQQLFGVSDKHLETWRYFLNCSHVQKAPEDFNMYGEFARDYTERLGR